MYPFRGLDLLLRTAPSAAEKYDVLRQTGCLSETALGDRADVIALMDAYRHVPGGRVSFDAEDDDQQLASALAGSAFLSERGRRLYTLEAVEYWTWDAGGRGVLPVEREQGDTLTGLARPVLPQTAVPKKSWWRFWAPRSE